jgi:SAM-dependent methyltransferase
MEASEDQPAGGHRAPAAERNRKPILDVLARVLPERGTVLEIASGTGQHVAFFAGALPGLVWQPSELDPHTFGSIAAWTESAHLMNVRPPLRLDVTEPLWPVDEFDAIFNANTIHIAPWEVCLGLLRGAGRHLRPRGVLVLYGPFRIDGKHTAASNIEFDRDLRARDPAWGVRDLEAVVDAARENGIVFEAQVPMPANNQTLVFRAGG